MWPDWTIYWTLGNFSKSVATISLPKSPTFLGNFCKGVKILIFCGRRIFGQLLQTFGDFLLVTLFANTVVTKHGLFSPLPGSTWRCSFRILRACPSSRSQARTCWIRSESICSRCTPWESYGLRSSGDHVGDRPTWPWWKGRSRTTLGPRWCQQRWRQLGQW